VHTPHQLHYASSIAYCCDVLLLISWYFFIWGLKPPSLNQSSVHISHVLHLTMIIRACYVHCDTLRNRWYYMWWSLAKLKCNIKVAYKSSTLQIWNLITYICSLLLFPWEKNRNLKGSLLPTFIEVMSYFPLYYM
jgi:hypothetical protein